MAAGRPRSRWHRRRSASGPELAASHLLAILGRRLIAGVTRSRGRVSKTYRPVDTLPLAPAACCVHGRAPGRARRRRGPSAPDGGGRMEPTAVDPAGRPMGRRRFIRMLLGFSALSTLAMVATPIIGFLIPPRTAGAGAGGRVLAATTDDLPIGSRARSSRWAAARSSSSTPTSGVKAYSAVCTHLGCIVDYDATSSQIVCPCHDGHFNPASGGVVSGPPPAAAAADRGRRSRRTRSSW